VRRLVIRDALIPVGAGAGIGSVAAFWLAGLLETLLYDTAPHDPLAFGLALAALTSVAALAAFVPARRATRLEPIATLRIE
jgi:ABC-type antimicrobial peptide transport system permease subunit